MKKDRVTIEEETNRGEGTTYIGELPVGLQVVDDFGEPLDVDAVAEADDMIDVLDENTKNETVEPNLKPENKWDKKPDVNTAESVQSGREVPVTSTDYLWKELDGFAQEEDFEQMRRILRVVSRVFEGEERDDGTPVLNHSLVIMEWMVADGWWDEDLLVAAGGHDLFEDTKIVGDKLREYGFSDQQIELIEVLTKKRKWDENGQEIMEDLSYEEKAVRDENYFEKLSQNPRAAVIKIYDRLHNLKTMGDGWNLERRTKYVWETSKYVLPLFALVKEYYDGDEKVVRNLTEIETEMRKLLTELVADPNEPISWD